MFARLRELLKEILFPVFCVECGAEGEWWCDKCRGKNKIFREDQSNAVFPLDGLTAFFVYDEQAPIGKLIKSFKYNFARDIEKVFEKIINEEKGFLTRLGRVGMTIVPVPLHPRRERERGFNQAEVLAKIIFNCHSGPGAGIQSSRRLDTKNLVRARYTNQQARLSGEERQNNVSGAFAWKDGAAPEEILLVDDVYTTGATMRECARALKSAGAKKVWGVVLARG